MHIQQIEIDNFKSFAGKTTIPFENGFTTVSGPNGSGKSNIIDSILFCLGLSSSRTMRAEKLTDLINNFSKRREAIVTILFGDSDDPTDEKIIVSRRIKDNGASGYTSTYYLNGKVSTLTEIHDRLGQHNISPGGYNVLMQGDVTGIINMTPMERRKIIDEIAGVAEFDRKIDQAQRELESVSGSIERFSILLTELQGRVEQLAAERDQALKYQSLKDKKQQQEGMLLSSKFLDLQKALQATEQNIVQARKHKTTSQHQLAELESTIATTRDELNKLAAEVKRKGEDQQIALKKQIEGLKGAISRKKDSITFGSEKRQEHLRQLERGDDDMARFQQKIEDLETALEGFTHRESELNALLQKETEALKALEEKYTRLIDSTGALGERRTQTRESLTQAEDTLSRLNRDRLDVMANLERALGDKQHLETRLASTSGAQGELETRKAQVEKYLTESSLERQAFESQVHGQQRTVSELRVQLNTASAEVNRLHREYTQLDAQRRAYDEMNFGRSIDTVLNAGMDGVHGTLSQLANVDEEYSIALEIALGGRMNNIVVDHDGVAQRGIELLQRTKSGRATFLPLNKMRSAQHLPLLPNDDGIIDYAFNLVEFDESYRDVFAYALGDTVIVEDMAVARRYQRKYRMVSLEGSLFEKTGAMTGGSFKPQASGRLSSGKADGQLAALRAELEAKDEEKNRLEKQLTSAEIKLDALKGDFSNYLGKLQTSQLELDALNRELKQLVASGGDASQVEALTTQIEEFRTRHGVLETEIVNAEKSVESLKAALEAIDSELPTAELEQLKIEMNAAEFQVRAVETQIRNLANNIQSRKLEKEFQEKGLQSIQEQMVQIQKQNEAIEVEKIKLLEEIELLNKQIVDLEAQAGVLDEELQRLQAERDAVQSKLIEQEHQKHNLARDMAQIDEQISAYQARKRELQPEIEAVKTELSEAGLDPEAVATLELPALDEIHKEIQKLTRQMDAMGAVNMRAIQDYDEVMSRHSELEERIGTLTREREDLGIKISGYAELKYNAFITAFDNVDRNFKEIFADLSDGEGQLVLTNPAEPFSGGLTIEARPRGKKMLRIESMSGGEKSLTALAFVFAFQRYMPAPFYAFDEVDMFLDGINAEKLAHMVRKQSGTAQFIVVSLRKPMLANSDRTVGVTQKRDGVSKVTGVLLRDAS